MLLSECPHGVDCFVDANILSYHFVQYPLLSDRCTDFLCRVDAGELSAHTTTSAVADVVHKVMLAEAAERHHLSRDGLVGRLRRHPELLTSLTEHARVVPDLTQVGIVIHPVDSRDVEVASATSSRYGLLTGDALIVAVMERLGLLHLVLCPRNTFA